MRVAEERDIPIIVEMARQVHEGTMLGDVVPFIPEDASKSFTKMLDQSNHSFLVEGDPAIAVFAVRFQKMIANHGCRMGMELFWFVQPEHRGIGMRFAKEAENWIRDQGMYILDLSMTSGLDPRVMMLYQRMGYVPSEFHFMKVL